WGKFVCLGHGTILSRISANSKPGAIQREMGLRTVAEGVECHDVAERLKAYGCGIGQGWWWAPAMSETAFSSWLRHRIGTMTQSA
ncbi:hypothetical protein LIOPPNJA_20990, partial [Robbsia andropogonis]|nr:hypothetical protein [Robbsia andropogonis]MCP1130293.1 hypothetical protein [Robbsia andropogonis]